MYFRFLYDESTGSLSYLLADLDFSEAVAVDPLSADVSVIAAMLDEYRLHLRWVLRTHEHDSVIPGEADDLDTLGAPRIEHQAPHCGVLPFGGELIRVIPTPGHTPRCLSFLWRDRLFCGDLLSMDLCPYQPLPALPETMWDSVTRRVFTLPSETLIFSGHAPRARAVTTVMEERRWHPWFAGVSRDEFRSRCLARRSLNRVTSPHSGQ